MKCFDIYTFLCIDLAWFSLIYGLVDFIEIKNTLIFLKIYLSVFAH